MPTQTPPTVEVPNPLDAIQAWIARQPEGIRSTIYFMIGWRVIDRDSVDDLDFIAGPKKHFDRWVQEKRELRRDDVISAALYLRELIQFFAIDHFGSREEWKDMVDSNAAIANEFRAKAPGATLVQDLDEMALSAPFRGKLWERAANSWNTFVVEHLTNKHLVFWKILNPDAEVLGSPE